MPLSDVTELGRHNISRTALTYLTGSWLPIQIFYDTAVNSDYPGSEPALTPAADDGNSNRDNERQDAFSEVARQVGKP